MNHPLDQGSATLGMRATTGTGQHNHWHTKKILIFYFYFITIIKRIKIFMWMVPTLSYILVFCISHSANMFLNVSENGVLRWDTYIYNL